MVRKLEFVEVSARPGQHCHSEPVRFPGVGISIEFQAAHRHRGVLTCHFPKFIHEKWCFYPGDCHTSDIGHWFAMTGSSIPHPSARQIPILVIGLTQQPGKLEFDGELGIDSLRRGRVSRPFA